MVKELREFWIWTPAGIVAGALLGALFSPTGYWPADAGLGAVVGGVVGIGISQVRGSS